MAHTVWHNWTEVFKRGKKLWDTGHEKEAIGSRAFNSKYGQGALNLLANVFDTPTSPNSQKMLKSFVESGALPEEDFNRINEGLAKGEHLLPHEKVISKGIEGVSGLPTLVGLPPIDTRLTGTALTASAIGRIPMVPKGSKFYKTVQSLKTKKPSLRKKQPGSIDVEAFDPSTRIDPMTSSSIRKYKALQKRSSARFKSELEALKVEQGGTSASVLASIINQKGNFVPTKTTKRLNRLIDEIDRPNIAKQLGYANENAIEIGKTWDGIGARDAKGKQWSASRIDAGSIGGEGIVKPTKLTDKIRGLLKDVDPDLARRDIAKRYADNPSFMKKLIKLHSDVRKYVDGPGKGRLAGYPTEGRTIKAPDGIEYRVRDSNKAGGTGKFSMNQDVSAKNTAEIRKIARQPDEGSLLPHFKQYTSKGKAKEALESYKTTSQKIYKALESARSRYNIKLKKAGVPKSEHATVEHIFDVDFYKRLKDEVPGFKGQGADEAWNLKMISFALNSKTGALNKKAKDIGQVLIDAIRKDEFIDYDKVVREFVQNNLDTKINKLKPKDWDRITEFSMKNPNLNMQQILLEYTKNL